MSVTFVKISFDGDFADLEPYIDATTMEVHQEKHHQGYADKVNAALEGVEHEFEEIEDVLANIESLPEDVQTAVRNNGGGLANHNLFFQILTPESQEMPEGDLADEIEKTFGSFYAFKEKFESAATGQFGSGWAWLVVDEDGALKVYSTPNQDSPHMQGDTPILGLDVWEHAYYLHYQNRRAEYVQNFWNVVDWEKVGEFYEGGD